MVLAAGVIQRTSMSELERAELASLKEQQARLEQQLRAMSQKLRAIEQRVTQTDRAEMGIPPGAPKPPPAPTPTTAPYPIRIPLPAAAERPQVPPVIPRPTPRIISHSAEALPESAAKGAGQQTTSRPAQDQRAVEAPRPGVGLHLRVATEQRVTAP